jgi:glutamine synthetase
MPDRACISMCPCRTVTGATCCRGGGGALVGPAIRTRLGGLRATMGESMLVFAPHANSWRRFANAKLCAGVAHLGGEQPLGRAAHPRGRYRARRIEHRPAGVDANPYLVAATVLAGIRHGLAQRIDPGPETTGNGYAARAPQIPARLAQRDRAAQGSAFLKSRWARTCTAPSVRSRRRNMPAWRARSRMWTTIFICTRSESVSRRRS